MIVVLDVFIILKVIFFHYDFHFNNGVTTASTTITTTTATTTITTMAIKTISIIIDDFIFVDLVIKSSICERVE